MYLLKNQRADPSFFVELPYTLPKDSTLFIILQEKSIDIWKRELDWIAEQGGMALVNTHPDYMDSDDDGRGDFLYPIKHYTDFLEYVQRRYADKYFHALPAEIATSCGCSCLFPQNVRFSLACLAQGPTTWPIQRTKRTQATQ